MAEERVTAESQPEVAPAAPVAAPVAPTTAFGGAGAGASMAAALRTGNLPPSGVLALQRLAGNQAVANVLARDTPAAAPAATPTANRTPAFTVEVPEALTDWMKLEGKAAYVKGTLAVKGEVQFVAVEAGVEASNNTVGGSTGSQGTKVEIELSAKDWVADWVRSLSFEKVEEGLTFEAGLKKLEASIGLTAKAKTKYDWCKGIVEGKFIGIGVEWDKIKEASVGAFEVAGGFTGEGKVTLGGTDYIAKPKVQLSGKVEPDWVRIAAKAAEQGVKEGAKQGARGAVQATATEAGVTAIAVDGAAVGSAVAAIAIPFAAAVAMGFGAYQAMRNAKTAQDAAGHGAVLRDQANVWAKNYARTMTGHAGEGPGAEEAEKQIAALMAEHNAPREFVLTMVREKRGGYLALRDEALGLIKPKMREEAIKAFEESHKDDFGIIDSLGPEWGTRGVFRKHLDQVLMWDTAPGGG